MSLIPRSLLEDDFLYPLIPSTHHHRSALNAPQLAVPSIHNGRYNVNLDLHQFDPSELSVKVEKNTIKVSGKREKKTEGDHGQHYEYRQYEQHFTVPDSVDVEQLKSQLDKRGILRLEAPVKTAAGDKSRHIPIEFVNKK